MLVPVRLLTSAMRTCPSLRYRRTWRIVTLSRCGYLYYPGAYVMAKVHPGRFTAEIEGDFVVFLIGMRINKFWKLHKWLPVALAMPPMQRQQQRDASIGMLGQQAWF